MTPNRTARTAPASRALGIYAAANTALANEADAGAIDRYLQVVAGVTDCDLILVYERSNDAVEGWGLAAQWGIAAHRRPLFAHVAVDETEEMREMGVGFGATPAQIEARLDPLLRESGMRKNMALRVRSEEKIAAMVLFCSRNRETFHPDVLPVFAATGVEIGRALARQHLASVHVPGDESPREGAQQQFIAVLAHELRNPIAPIRSGLDLMATGLLDAEGRRLTLDMMRRQLDHLVRLIDDLLDTVRLRTGKLQVKREPVVLRDVVRSAIETIRPALFAKQLALTLDDEQSDVVLDADPVRLSQAFVNVLSANVKQTPEGGVVSVAVTAAVDKIHITFEDEAPAVDPESLTAIFELFPKDAPQHSEDGLGIGLALVRGLVELNDGTVSARARDQRAGACYVVSLPRPSTPMSPPAPRASEAPGTWTSHRILIVDDNLDAASTLGLLLELDGATIRLAHDGPNAVEETRQFQPEVILLDIGIPGFDGNEAARRIRAMDPPVRPLIIALTGWGAKHDRDATAASGFDLHLVKPIAHDQLCTAVRTLMNQQQAHGRH